MTINNYKQKATGHVTSLANGHVTGSDAHFECEIPTASSNIKIYNFANFGLAMGTPAGFAPTKECFKRSRWFGKWHKTWGIYCQSCLYPTNSPWPAFLTPFLLPLPVSGHLSRGFTVPPNKACLLCATHSRHLPSAVPGFPKIIYCCCLGTFCVHHTTMRHVKSLHAKPHTYEACVFSCSLPPALLAEWPGSFVCYWGSLSSEFELWSHAWLWFSSLCGFCWIFVKYFHHLLAILVSTCWI